MSFLFFDFEKRFNQDFFLCPIVRLSVLLTDNLSDNPPTYAENKVISLRKLTSFYKNGSK